MFPQCNNAWHTVGVKNVYVMNILITTILWGRTGLSFLHHHWNISASSWKSSDLGKFYLAIKFAFPQISSTLLPESKISFCVCNTQGQVLCWVYWSWMRRLIKARRIERRYCLRQRSHNQFLLILHLEKLKLRDLVLSLFLSLREWREQYETEESN